MKTKKYIIFLFIILNSTIKAQDNLLFLIENLPQTMEINPSFRPIDKWYLTVPALGGYEIGLRNSGYTWQQLANDNTLSTLQRNNVAIMETSWQIFGGGIAYGDLFLSFDLNHKRKAFIKYPASVMDFRRGNWDYDNNTPLNYSTSGMEGMGIDYTELALGFSMPLSDIITIGIRLKYLMGAANFKIENMDIDITTEQNGDINVYSQTSLLSSVPENVEFKNRGILSTIEYNNNPVYITNNHGFAIDGGITAKLQIYDKDLTLGFAFQDLGCIYWKNNSTRYTINDSYTIDGTDITNVILGNPSSTIIDYWEALGDSIDNNFAQQESPENYNTLLQGNFNLTAAVKYNEWLNFGAILKNYYANKMFIPSLGISAAATYANKYTATIGYTATKNSYANIGAGFAAKIKMFQIYAVTDNLFTIFAPDRTKYLCFKMGINIIPESNKSNPFSRYKGNSVYSVKSKKPHKNRKTSSIYKSRSSKSKGASGFNGSKISNRKTSGRHSGSAKYSGPEIKKIVNSYNKEENSTITPEKELRIEGKNIKITGEDQKTGLWLINTKSNSRTKVTQVITNSDNELIVTVPALEDGIYRLELSTQYKDESESSEQVKTTKFKYSLKTVQEQKN